MPSTTFDALLAEFQKALPGLTVRYKPDSLFMRMIGSILFFNPEFYARYATTFGSTVYMSSLQWVLDNPDSAKAVLAHEAVHVDDYRQHPITYTLGYAFPQGLALVGLLGVFAVLFATHSLIAVVALAVGALLFGAFVAFSSRAAFHAAGVAFWTAIVAWLLGAVLANHLWGGLAVAAVLLPLAPWPSPGRVRWELRGYTMSLAAILWTTGSIPDETVAWAAAHFTDFSYYRMSWDKADIAARFAANVAALKSGEFVKREGRMFELVRTKLGAGAGG